MKKPKSINAFTLVEVLISMSITIMMVATLLTAFLFFSKLSINITNYAQMESEKSLFLQYFGQDSRNAQSINWINTSEFILTSNALQTTYTYNPQDKTLIRAVSGEKDRQLLTNILNLTFVPYNNKGRPIPMGITTDFTDISHQTKMIQATGAIKILNPTATNTSTQFTSSRHMLRNKPIN
jgi:type II secretory pathway pseudopilin PulG